MKKAEMKVINGVERHCSAPNGYLVIGCECAHCITIKLLKRINGGEWDEKGYES